MAPAATFSFTAAAMQIKNYIFGPKAAINLHF
jgi:hypothetical protein